MSDFVKKTAMGYKTVQAGQSDPECTHVILTKDEYNELYLKIRLAENEARTANKQFEQLINQSQEEASNLVLKNQKAINEKNEEIARLNYDLEYQKNLNKNLLRISKERANAARNLHPKKEHTGYKVLSSKERTERYKAGKTVKYATVWETTLESPYSIDFSEIQARTQIAGELLTNEGGWLLGKVGINNCWMIDFEKLVNSSEVDVTKQNTAYSQRLRANYKTGYWEYIVLHSLPLSTVPKEMLP